MELLRTMGSSGRRPAAQAQTAPSPFTIQSLFDIERRTDND